MLATRQSPNFAEFWLVMQPVPTYAHHQLPYDPSISAWQLDGAPAAHPTIPMLLGSLKRSKMVSGSFLNADATLAHIAGAWS
jgi:hypothetical protein